MRASEPSGSSSSGSGHQNPRGHGQAAAEDLARRRRVREHRERGDVEGPAVDAKHRKHRREAPGQRDLAHVPGDRAGDQIDARSGADQRAQRCGGKEVDDATHRHAGRVQTQLVDSVDAPLEVEDGAVGANLHRL